MPSNVQLGSEGVQGEQQPFGTRRAVDVARVDRVRVLAQKHRTRQQPAFEDARQGWRRIAVRKNQVCIGQSECDLVPRVPVAGLVAQHARQSAPVGLGKPVQCNPNQHGFSLGAIGESVLNHERSDGDRNEWGLLPRGPDAGVTLWSN